ncbi:unnamed protein product [Rhizophagus irregularis]|nr:unnamed protein product [Rhizophagus irregularis]CAB4446631.1 unnamed protein product [Rhizophagus irregularis]
MPQEKRQKTSKGKEKASYIKRIRASLTEYDVSQGMISDILKESEKCGELLAQKACDFATLLDVQDFKGCDGWVAGFKKRHNLKSYIKHEEAASALSEKDLNEMRKDLQNILKKYSPDDIFNIDETGLYWKIELNRTLSTGLSKLNITYGLILVLA